MVGFTQVGDAPPMVTPQPFMTEGQCIDAGKAFMKQATLELVPLGLNPEFKCVKMRKETSS